MRPALTRTLPAAILLLLFLVTAGGSDRRSAAFSPPRLDDFDLCSLLPGDGPTTDRNGDGKTECWVNGVDPGAPYFTFGIRRWSTPEDAQETVRNWHDAYSGSDGEPDFPSAGFGDIGFIMPERLNYHSAKIHFARGCYTVWSEAGWLNGDTSKPRPPGEMLALAGSVDGALKTAPCGSSSQPVATTNTTGSTEPTSTPIPNLNLLVDHIEVVQVIQRQGNEIPLVAGKKTVVRVFVQANSRASDPIPVRVTASLFVWPEGGSEAEVNPAPLPIIVSPNKPIDREVTESSINFVIPSQLTAAGVFSLKVVVNPDHAVQENNYDDNDYREPFEFVQRNGLRVGFVRIGYKPPGTTQWEWPGTTIGTYAGQMQKLFPAADNGIQYYEMPWRVRATRPLSTDDLGEDLNWTLREFYDRLEGDKPDILVGWLPNEYANTINFGGLAETVLSGQAAHVLLAVDYHDDYSSKHVLPHEVGHDLGLKHPATTGDPTSDCRLSKDSSPDWPKEYNNSATIHEVGFDTETMKVIPSSYYDLMAYCNEQKSWISPFHYKKLFDFNLRPQGAFITDRAHILWVRGWASLKGDTASIEVVRPPASGGMTSPEYAGPSSIDGGFAPDLGANLNMALVAPSFENGAGQSGDTAGTGDHCVQFISASGEVLHEQCFELKFQSNETSEPTERAGFVLDVPDPGNVARVFLVRKENGQSRELASIEASAQPPDVTINSPRSGDRWAGEHTITWDAGDPDGNAALRYDVLYSPDGKQSWYPLEVGTLETSYTFSTDEILPSDQTYIRVIASDGFNTSHADVGPLVVPSQPNSPQPPPPPPPPAGSASDATGPGGVNLQSGLSGLNWGVIGITGGGVVALLVVLLVFRASRRRPKQAQAEAARFCGRCGSALPPDALFCGICGTPVPRN